ncbi:hypothetical protein F3F16_004997 [Escherichia coli]|nr:hypothetical protein [Escherichia coli]EET3520240.1 hypothetical protein [Escherichia coli]EET4440846.1 hypothetical protein [Escherichia coli]
MQKSLLVEQAFRIWSVIEDYSPLRGSPCGPLLAQRSLASLESNLPAPGGSHPHRLQMQKSLLVEQAFRILIEYSNIACNQMKNNNIDNHNPKSYIQTYS